MGHLAHIKTLPKETLVCGRLSIYLDLDFWNIPYSQLFPPPNPGQCWQNALEVVHNYILLVETLRAEEGSED